MQFCEPLEELPPLSSKAKLSRVAAFFVKGAIVAGLICWTCTEGLWGDSTQTEDLYYRMMRAIFPDLPDRPVNKRQIYKLVKNCITAGFVRTDTLSFTQTHLPHLEGMKYSAAEAYNHMLVRGMDIIVSVPREVHRRLRDLLFPCDTTKKTERKHGAKHSDENSAES